MFSPHPQLVLLIPGLCGPESDPPVSDYLDPRPPALDRLLSRARIVEQGRAGMDATLCHWCGLDAGDALPVAPLTWRADTRERADGYLMRADPVYLRADQSVLRLFDASTFEITRVEADQLTEAFNVFFTDRGWRLQAPDPRRWYLRLDTPPDIETTPLAQLGGQDIDPFLPRGREATDWHRTLNEVQMLFHDHPVNVARAARGEPLINSLWFWGGGRPATLQPRVARIATDHPLGLGLSMEADIPRTDVPRAAEELLAPGEGGITLVVNDTLASATQYGDVETWVDGLRELESHWFAPLLAALRQGRLASLVIDPCQGRRFTIDKQQRYHVWKRDRPFEARCRQ